VSRARTRVTSSIAAAVALAAVGSQSAMAFPGPGPSEFAARPPAATLHHDGSVSLPRGAPRAVRRMVAAANSIRTDPYVYTAAPRSWRSAGYDSLGATELLLHAGGRMHDHLSAKALRGYGRPGLGNWVSVYVSRAHTFIVIDGLAFNTAHYGPTRPAGPGPRWLARPFATANLTDGNTWIVRHPAGL
jgi:hypothetical protein